jgi:hypothetical protein
LSGDSLQDLLAGIDPKALEQLRQMAQGLFGAAQPPGSSQAQAARQQTSTHGGGSTRQAHDHTGAFGARQGAESNTTHNREDGCGSTRQAHDHTGAFGARQGAESNTAHSREDGGGSTRIDPVMLAKLSALLNRRREPDSRAALIEAIKPHLSERHRAKADQALGLLRAMELIPLLNELQ